MHWVSWIHLTTHHLVATCGDNENWTSLNMILYNVFWLIYKESIRLWRISAQISWSRPRKQPYHGPRTGCITRFVKRGWGKQFQGAYLNDRDFRFEAAASSPEVRPTLCSKVVEIIIKRALRSISQIGPCVYTNPVAGVWVSVAFSYPACNAHTPYCHLWPALLYDIFPHNFINGTILEKKLPKTKCVFWFSLQLLSETFLILRRDERGMIKMHIGLHVITLYSSPILMTLIFYRRIFEKILKHQVSWKFV